MANEKPVPPWLVDLAKDVREAVESASNIMGVETSWAESAVFDSGADEDMRRKDAELAATNPELYQRWYELQETLSKVVDELYVLFPEGKYVPR
jgi:acetyl-CoA carboxylase carboxyltransferase component